MFAIDRSGSSPPPRPALTLAGLAGVCCATLLALGSEPAPPASSTASPGQIALSVRHAQMPQIIESWQQALREGGPEARAAAARVAHASRAEKLIDSLRAALHVESDPQAASEEAAALASLAGPEEDVHLLEAGKRLGPQELAAVALILARTRGAGAITAYLPEVKPDLVAEGQIAEFLSLAARKDPAALESAARAALEEDDGKTWRAAVGVSITEHLMLSAGTLGAALRHRSAELAGETAWRLAAAFAGKPPSNAAELLASLEGGAGSAPGDVGADLEAGKEMLARALGRDPIERKDWIEYLGSSRHSRIDDHETQRALSGLLVSKELKALKKRFARLYPERTVAKPSRGSTRIQKVLADTQGSPSVVRLATGFPRQFVSGVIAESGCLLTAGPILAVADLSYDGLGRPRKVDLKRSPPSVECIDAVSALFTSSIWTGGALPDPEKPERLLLVLEAGYLSRLEREDPLGVHPVYLTAPVEGEGEIKPPKRTRFVKPDYPSSARERRKEGKVILEIVVNRAGLVSDIRALKRTDDEFVPTTFASVAQWRYAPALQDGRPVSVYLTVIVEYRLR